MNPTPRACFAAIALLGLGVASTGCGAVVYTADVIAAGSVVAEAEAAGAAELSPYEFYAAREYLTKAREEASEASYEDAVRFADEAGRLGRLARDQARAARTTRTQTSGQEQPARSETATERDVENEMPPGQTPVGAR